MAGRDVHAGLLDWIDRLKPMVQLGAESFHEDLLRRWKKRHGLRQLDVVLDALDATRQDYTVFQLLSDFQSTPEELIETLRRLALAGYRRPRMRIASSPLTIPLYDSDTRRWLEYAGPPQGRRAEDFRAYERPQPGWMDPLVAELADLADAELRFALELEHREGALHAALAVVVVRLRGISRGPQQEQLLDQAERAMDEIRSAQFQAATQ
jgi:hypothetical protein